MAEPKKLYEANRLTVEVDGDRLAIFTADLSHIDEAAALELSKVLERWATRLEPATSADSPGAPRR